MRNWLTRLGRFLRAEEGPTAVEYAFMLALIIAVCYTAISTVGSAANSQFSNDKLKTAVGGGSSSSSQLSPGNSSGKGSKGK